jgi:hypothetical protein
MLQGAELSERVCDQALAPVESDIPAGVSVADWRSGREVTQATVRPWWRRLARVPRRSLAAVPARSAAR